jgi:hypothetical protein
VRDQLHLNPIEFDSEDQVLADFKARLRDGRFSPVKLPPPKEVELRLEFKALIRGIGELHRYRLKLIVTNTGTERLTDYWSELRFPKAAIEGDRNAYGRAGETSSHVIFRLDRVMMGVDLYPEQPIDFFEIDYHMNHDLFWGGAILKQPVVGLFGSPGMTTKRIEAAFREFQEF